MIELVNRQRRANGLPPLKHVTALSDAARWYAKDMVDDDYFGPGHDTYDRKGGRLVRVCAWGARLSAYYPGASARAENLGEGYSSPQEVVDGWMGSSGHRANILNGRYWETGVGYQAGASDEPRWVQDFGRRRSVYPVVINDEAASTDDRLVEPLRLRQLERDPRPERQRGLRPLAALHPHPGVDPGRSRRAAHRRRRDAQGIDHGRRPATRSSCASAADEGVLPCGRAPSRARRPSCPARTSTG